jgi:hypothetical protein
VKRFNRKLTIVIFLIVLATSTLNGLFPVNSWMWTVMRVIDLPGSLLTLFLPFALLRSSTLISALFWSLLGGLLFRYQRMEDPIEIARAKRAYKIAALVGAIVLCSIIISLYLFFRPLYQLAHIEQNTRNAITAPQLQMWATNIIAHYPDGSHFRASELSTNFPRELLELAPALGPRVTVHGAYDSDRPGWVSISWGSGFAGHAAIEIGPTNFVAQHTPNSIHTWQDGVYFWDENRR